MTRSACSRPERGRPIQQSLLVEEPPPFAGYEIAARSVPAEEVGGDFFDFLPFDDELLGLAIGDASGHGLPAALLVRDVVTGLRMGIEKDLKIAQVFARLNRVIHRSNLTAFISVFYGELEASGNIVYINAGHPPPLIFSKKGPVTGLATGGTVIGPLPEARFLHGHARLDPGDVLVLCTDGILERRNPDGEFFGEERLRAPAGGGPGRGAKSSSSVRISTDFSRRRCGQTMPRCSLRRRTSLPTAASGADATTRPALAILTPEPTSRAPLRSYFRETLPAVSVSGQSRCGLFLVCVLSWLRAPRGWFVRAGRVGHPVPSGEAAQGAGPWSKFPSPATARGAVASTSRPSEGPLQIRGWSRPGRKCRGDEARVDAPASVQN